MGASSVTGTGTGSAEGPVRGVGAVHKILNQDDDAAFYYQDGKIMMTGFSEPIEVILQDGTEIGLVDGTEIGLVEGASVEITGNEASVRILDENQDVLTRADLKNIHQTELLENILLELRRMNIHFNSITEEEIPYGDVLEA